MSVASYPSCWVRVVFFILKDDFFLNRKSQEFFLEISAISHEKVKKPNKLNAKSYLTFSKKPKNKRHLCLKLLVLAVCKCGLVYGLLLKSVALSDVSDNQ